MWNATWITNRALRLVEKYRIPLRTETKPGESVEIIFIILVAGGAGFGGKMGQLFAKDLYGYVKKRITKWREERTRKPGTRQVVRIVRHSREWDEVIQKSDEEPF